MTCQLNPQDKMNVTSVWNDLNDVIKRGKDNQFIEKIDQIINTLVTS